MRKGQVTLEYIILISIIVLALVGMAAYLTRSVSGKWREAADSIGFGKQYGAGGGQYIYECTPILMYSCAKSCEVTCSGGGGCTPTCYSISDTATSTTSMPDACALAVAKINKQDKPGCSGKKRTCGWYTLKYIYTKTPYKLVNSWRTCPGSP